MCQLAADIIFDLLDISALRVGDCERRNMQALYRVQQAVRACWIPFELQPHISH